MLKRNDAASAKGRGTGRWFGVIAAVAVLTLGAAGCTAETAALSEKSLGDNELAMPASLVDTIEPIASASVPTDFPEGEAAGTVQPVEGVLTASDYEIARLPRIHLTIVSPDTSLKKKGETYKNKPNSNKRSECINNAVGGRGALINAPMVLTDIKAGPAADSCLEEKGDPEIELTYSIPGTSDLLWIYTKVPDWGDNVLMCSVIDPKTWKTNLFSDYTCSSQWMQDGGHGWNPLPRVKLSKKPIETITDPLEQDRILSKECNENQPTCKYVATSQTVEQTPESHWQVLSGPHNACGIPGKSDKHEWSSERSFGWENTIGGGLSVEFGIPKVVKIGIDVKYEHTWTEKYVFGQRLESEVEYGWAHVFYAQPTYLHIQGDFTVTQRDRIALIPKADFRLPMATSYKVNGQTVQPVQTHARAWKITCPDSGDKDKQLQALPIPPISEMKNVDSEMKIG